MISLDWLDKEESLNATFSSLHCVVDLTPSHLNRSRPAISVCTSSSGAPVCPTLLAIMHNSVLSGLVLPICYVEVDHPDVVTSGGTVPGQPGAGDVSFQDTPEVFLHFLVVQRAFILRTVVVSCI